MKTKTRKPKPTPAQTLLGGAEVAQIAGVSRQAVSNWRARHDDFPSPAFEFAQGPVFRATDIKRWLRKHGKGAA